MLGVFCWFRVGYGWMDGVGGEAVRLWVLDVMRMRERVGGRAKGWKTSIYVLGTKGEKRLAA